MPGMLPARLRRPRHGAARLVSTARRFDRIETGIMHVVFLGINYWPDETGIAPFTTGRCEYLASRGHQVTVFTGFPYYPAWRIPEQYRRQVFNHEERNGVTIFRSWLYVPAQVNAARR